MRKPKFPNSVVRAMRSTLLLGSFGLVLSSAPMAFAPPMAWEVNTIDADAANWLITQNNTANGNNVDWVNSNLAGGTAGELGGTITRHTSTAFYGRLLDYTVTLNDPMHWMGV